MIEFSVQVPRRAVGKGERKGNAKHTQRRRDHEILRKFLAISETRWQHLGEAGSQRFEDEGVEGQVRAGNEEEVDYEPKTSGWYLREKHWHRVKEVPRIKKFINGT